LFLLRDREQFQGSNWNRERGFACGTLESHEFDAIDHVVADGNLRVLEVAYFANFAFSQSNSSRPF